MAKECDNASCTKDDCAGCKERQENGIPKRNVISFRRSAK